MSAPELASVLSNFCVGIATFILAIAAFRGINQWNAQLKGAAVYELVQRVGLLIRRFQHQFHRAMDQSSPEDSIDRPKTADEPASITPLLDDIYAKRKNVGQLRDTLEELRFAQWEIEGKMGLDLTRFFQPLEERYERFAGAVRAYTQSQLMAQRDPSIFTKFADKITEWEKVIRGDDNEFIQLLDDNVEALLKELRSHSK